MSNFNLLYDVPSHLSSVAMLNSDLLLRAREPTVMGKLCLIFPALSSGKVFIDDEQEQHFFLQYPAILTIADVGKLILPFQNSS